MFITSILLLLLSNAVTLRRDIAIFFNRAAIIILVYAILLGNVIFFIISKAIGLHGGLLQVNNMTQIWHSFLFIISVLILQLTSFYPRKIWITQHSSFKNFFENFLFFKAKIFDKKEEQFKIIEYPLILLFIINGAVFLMSTKDFVSIFLSIELQSYGLYLVCTLYRNSELSTTGGLMYFFLGGLSSCFILLATSLLYANSGTTSLDNLYIVTTVSGVDSWVSCWYSSNYIHFSLLIFSIGFLFKVGAAPFHFWSPDVYDVIPTIVTTFVAIVAKISIFVFLLELVYYTSDNFDLNLGWTYTLLISSLLSMIIGTVLGLTQFRIKRLFAYSTISHLGFILLALSISSIESIQAFIFYLMQYSISNLNAFVILVTIGFSLYNYTNNKQDLELLDQNNSPIQLISQLKGYFYINPFLALSLSITIFSFVGIPPLVGFFAKQMVLSAALNNGYIFLSLIAILTSVIGAVYYLNLIKELFFFKSDYKLNQLLINNNLQSKLYNFTENSVKSVNYKYNNIVLSSPIVITISTITLVILLFIFINKEWLSMSTILVQFMFNS